MLVRRMFVMSAIATPILIALIAPFWPSVLWFLIIVIPYIALGIYDMTHLHNILRNYPVIGHLRYLFEFIRPEIQQYFVATNLSGEPFNREQRSLVYQRAKDIEAAHPFGTEYDIIAPGYEYAQHSMSVKKISELESRTNVGGPQCKKPYNASRLNISAMSFGALSANAILAMNMGAKMGNFAQDTGEGGLCEYHLAGGGAITWEIGTGYFGCRTKDGNFDEIKFAEKANLDAVKMIEIKISQGAKPSHGGLLPAAKVSAEIARVRGIPMGEDCISPPMHKTFNTPVGLCQFIARLREITGGKPIGFKLCIGRHRDFMGICKAMLETGITPDFISIDGAEGGTGAAPLEYSNRIGVPINEALAFVENCLVGVNLRQYIHIIAAGKIVTGFDMVTKIALGADMCNMGRAMMFAVGCIQALRCNTNMCPTGVTTQDPARMKAVVPQHKSIHVYNLHKNTMQSFLDLTGSMGCNHPDDLTPDMIYFRVDEGKSITFCDMFHYVEPGNFLGQNVHPYYKKDWRDASAHHF